MSDQTPNPHTGHRQRLRSRYLKGGIAALSDVEIVELLLCYGIPRRDTNPLAHTLLQTYGGLAGVIEASVTALQNTPGMTEQAALLLHILPDLWQRYSHDRQKAPKFFLTTDQCGDYMMPLFRGERDEVIWLMCLDAKCRMLDCREIARGSVNMAAVPLRRLVETALAANASAVVLAHNHVSGIALPSAEDLQATKKVQTALDCVDILLVDHIIVADEDFVSLRDSNFM